MEQEVERLKGLIKKVEWSAQVFANRPACPWCLSMLAPISKAWHSPTCKAFKPDGAVR